MSVPIVTTPARTHLIEGDVKHYSMVSFARTVCGKDLAVNGERENGVYIGTHEGGDLAAGITCKNCRRTIAPSKVLFADDSTAVVGPGQVVAPALPASPTVELRWDGDSEVWSVHINFADPDSEPMFFMNGYEAEVTV